MTLRPRVVLTLLTFLLILAIPAVAAAATYTVDSNGDQADETVNGVCKTAANTCTLRAAIEEANGSTGVADEIKFSGFNAEVVADTIAIGSALPTIKDQLSIEGGLCGIVAGVKGPCVGVSGPGGGFSLQVEADDVAIRGLAVTGALIGINVINGSEGFVAQNDWLGVKLDGSAGANKTGIFIDPGSDGATIGGGEEAQRNVIAGNNNEGLDIEGASEAVVRGNYFGVAPDGTNQMANAKNIEITDSTAGAGFQAESNEVGRQLTAEAGATPNCDGGCNLISGALSYGVDLAGNGGNEAPASGPTLVAGNHIGLAASGAAAIPNAQYGVLVGNAGEASIGGPLGGHGNHINGGVIGVLAGSSADDLVVSNNQIGIDGAGNQLAPPSEGINVSSEEIGGLGHEAEIQGNSIAGTGTGITQHSVGAFIEENEILDPGIGIYTYGFVGAHGNLIADNAIVGAGQQGILLENDDNFVVGNKVLESGAAGIRIQRFFTLGASGNQIGGDSESDENVISSSGGPAIEIEDFENTNNEIARNIGGENGGPFIELISTEPGTEPNGPNEGVKPPTFSTAIQSKAEGTAEPGATIRVFRKASAEPGELASFLGEALADGSGNWKVTYGSLPVGTIVAATQTNANGGTSELATATAGADPSGGGNNGGGAGNNGAGGGGNNGGGNGANKDTTPPQTKILKAPPKKTHKTTVKFKFSSSEPGSTFQCKLDRKPFKKCSSPKKYKKLKPGKHVFKVRAIDRAGNVDPTPAKRKFTVLG